MCIRDRTDGRTDDTSAPVALLVPVPDFPARARGPASAATVESRSHLRRLRLRAARVRPSSHDRSACVGPAYACSWIHETVVHYDYIPCTVTRVYPNNQVHTDDRPSRPRARADGTDAPTDDDDDDMSAPPQGQQIPTFKLILVGDGGTGARARRRTTTDDG